MLPGATLRVPASLMTLPATFAPLFAAPSFRTFTMLACGFLAQPGKRTVCGMLAGAGVARLRPRDRARWFFSRARWSPGDLGLAVAKLVAALAVPAGEPAPDGSAQGRHKTGKGNNRVVLAIIVRPPFRTRPVALPVMAELVVKGTMPASRLWLTRRMTQSLADALPGRDLHAVADSAYAGHWPAQGQACCAVVPWTAPPRLTRRGVPRMPGWVRCLSAILPGRRCRRRRSHRRAVPADQGAAGRTRTDRGSRWRRGRRGPRRDC